MVKNMWSCLRTPQASFLNNREGGEKENLKGFGARRPGFMLNKRPSMGCMALGKSLDFSEF